MNTHQTQMRHAVGMAELARHRARPNPWVGTVIVCADGTVFSGATSAPGGAHAEIVALNAAREARVSTIGATLYSTLEPCSHIGRTGACTTAIINAGISTVVVGIKDPDSRVAGRGLEQLEAAGIAVIRDVCADEVEAQLRPYIHHRTTGRPFVRLKMACTMDARITLPNGQNRITGDEARRRVHELRADSDVIITGNATVRADNPQLTVRDCDGQSPRRIVLVSALGSVPADAKVQPCDEWAGSLTDLLDELGSQGVIVAMVEAGSRVARSFFEQDLVDEYIFHIAPIVCGDNNTLPVFDGLPETTAAQMWHGTLSSVGVFGSDLEIILSPQQQKVGAS
ncbi:MAG: bifunctional diaminohydroxyphosphoribosylaminopyrimidine deaminase/5-amino-6-(5-phosphoribosylamino)uracil reductase RibD [Ilumatobacteraceae bacterium]|nr:bifunctional diaminohydroxyphosphoribosylaminopyrimidine deaminase/5-amino-6-(5-phosphoribosylamino)uracil reductase RibD [Ilumatobacteraceae bacterium]